jgi:hypothetical protein
VLHSFADRTQTLPCVAVTVQPSGFAAGIFLLDGSQSRHPNIVFTTNSTLRMNASDRIGCLSADRANSAVLTVEERVWLFIRHAGHASRPEQMLAACHSVGGYGLVRWLGTTFDFAFRVVN